MYDVNRYKYILIFKIKDTIINNINPSWHTSSDS